MKKYPSELHYGVRYPMKYLNSTDSQLRLYKIDWKVSFLKWVFDSKGELPSYFVFIEVLYLLLILFSSNTTS